MSKIPSQIPRPLHRGSSGRLVRIVEEKLKERGVLRGPVDGFFDARTRAAVRRVERQQGWITDGIIGNRLWRELTGQRKAPNGGGGMPPAQPPPPGSGPKGEVAFKTVSINVKSNPVMPQEKVLRDVRHAARQGDLIGWQEIGPARYFDAIKGLGPEWGHYMPKDGNLRIPTPISWNKSVWEKQDDGFLRTHNGLAKVSPHRYITWVKLEHKATGQEVVRINTHLVSGAWSREKPTTEWRQDRWRMHMDKLENLVARFKKQGENVIIGGDFNRDSYKVLGDQVRYGNKLHVGTHGKSTLDYVMHVRDEDLQNKGARVEKGFASDHDAVVVTYSLDKK